MATPEEIEKSLKEAKGLRLSPMECFRHGLTLRSVREALASRPSDTKVALYLVDAMIRMMDEGAGAPECQGWKK